jgi:transcriptional regulator with XRE-family HTH domain
MEDQRRLQESDSILDALRIERTSFTQEEFAKRCGIPLRTYVRWINGETQARPTPVQMKAICKELGISKVDDIPDDFARKLVKT